MVSNLGTWFHPALPREYMAEHLEVVRGFIYESLLACETSNTSPLRELLWEDQQL